ncbi:LysR family transcriptional regulator [Bradyrhizobium sp. SHOUNA76]|uniref:LysR family transcriptional regulator n=2 Tax=unclassified Bradyrhizobium TaxID=2631580 RepID=UPI001FF3F358|nr:LysR family transcriptional regulator [Bradyrhizobium sp. SHOUNA76]MCJ9705356.1 LysR family transcriptional regulator [Bradyrhizobium sp. SHOUNA76]MCJ9733599.1 LysR family transcriptional regulator [Bradyrhizobium sp. PRIMUS42]
MPVDARRPAPSGAGYRGEPAAASGIKTGRVMELRWLQDFLMVAETGNFTRAAERRNTSQAAFSRRIKSLEAWLGFDLIDRSVYPTQLTPQGERFREHAGELLRQMLDSRDELGGKPLRSHEHIRIALPFAMATAQLPQWWQAWSAERRMSCSVVVGNIHDLVTSLVSGNADLMICYHHAQQPIHLDPDRYERVSLGTEYLRPYVSEALAAKGGISLPGKASHPVPLLMYSPGVYFARLVDLILENAPIAGQRVIESDMSDVLCEMALAGRGVAWLTEGTAAAHGHKGLAAIGGNKWALPLSLVAFKDRTNSQRSLNLFWSELCRNNAVHAADGRAGQAAKGPVKSPARPSRSSR